MARVAAAERAKHLICACVERLASLIEALFRGRRQETHVRCPQKTRVLLDDGLPHQSEPVQAVGTLRIGASGELEGGHSLVARGAGFDTGAPRADIFTLADSHSETKDGRGCMIMAHVPLDRIGGVTFQEAPHAGFGGQNFPRRETKKYKSAPQCQKRRTPAWLSG